MVRRTAAAACAGTCSGIARPLLPEYPVRSAPAHRIRPGSLRSCPPDHDPGYPDPMMTNGDETAIPAGIRRRPQRHAAPAAQRGRARTDRHRRLAERSALVPGPPARGPGGTGGDLPGPGAIATSATDRVELRGAHAWLPKRQGEWPPAPTRLSLVRRVGSIDLDLTRARFAGSMVVIELDSTSGSLELRGSPTAPARRRRRRGRRSGVRPITARRRRPKARRIWS